MYRYCYVYNEGVQAWDIQLQGFNINQTCMGRWFRNYIRPKNSKFWWFRLEYWHFLIFSSVNKIGKICKRCQRGVKKNLSAVGNNAKEFKLCRRMGLQFVTFVTAVEGLNCKRPIPKCQLFFKIDLLTDIAALCLTDFIDWRHSPPPPPN